MSFLKSWRKYHAEVERLARENSDSDSQLQLDQDVARVCKGDADSSSSRHTVNADSETDCHASDCDLDCYQSSSCESTDTVEGSDCVEESVTDNVLSEELASWATKNNCTRSSVNEILTVLRKHGHNIPKDARTLLHTPRFIETVEKCGGHYLYLGIETGLLKVMAQYPALFQGHEEVLLNFNIDGVPLFKSSNAQLWPVLCSIPEFEPFVVAVYYGNSKPNSVDEYLSDFLSELTNLKETGVSVNDYTYSVKVNAFVCDAPARAFLKCTKGHSGYNSCERCTVKGTWHGRVVFDDIDCDSQPQRTDVGFSNFEYEGHQVKISPLVGAGLSCISSFALDYMHLVCLGVVKRILTFLKQGPRECKLSHQQISHLSEKLCSLNGKMPREFARQPRSLHEMDKWKATEFRQFVLYTGPLVLRSVVSERLYHHFLSLTVSMSILLDPKETTRNAYLQYAKELMIYFIRNGPEIYGETFTSYNVHSLMHLASDVEHFGTSLNDVSAFQFENHLQKLKKIVKKSQNPIAQIAKRVTEMDTSRIRHYSRNLSPFVSTKLKDSCFLLKNERFAFVKEKREGKMFVCDVLKQRYLDSFFQTPCDSKIINIFVARNVSRHAKRRLVEHHEFEKKVVCLPYGENYLLLPMLHGIERQ